jgi:hypothetical protein
MVDRYTKAVLTVIATALVVLAVQGLVGPLGAQTREPQRVQICDGSHCASLTSRVTRIGGTTMTDWVLPTQLDDIQKVEICSGPSITQSCATVDSDLRAGGSLRVSPH